jgi:hypothetical protein
VKRLALSLALALAGCSTQPTGAGEPIVVYGGTFFPGPLPGSPPPDGGTPTAPDVTDVQSLDDVFKPGQAGRSMSGDVTDDASAIAVRFPDLGTGYWVVVPGAPDPNAPGSLSWTMTFDVGYGLPTGLNTLSFAAVSASGASGSQLELPVCIDTIFPDNLNACDVSLKPPAAVLSLAWDTPVDLDLQLVTPSGVVVSPEHPTTSVDGGTGPDVGELDMDSAANCAPSAVNREDIVWQGAPDPGQYLAYANLFSACGQESVRFTLTLYLAEPVDGGSALQPQLTTSGELLAADANGGVGLGLYLTAFSFPYP